MLSFHYCNDITVISSLSTCVLEAIAASTFRANLSRVTFLPLDWRPGHRGSGMAPATAGGRRSENGRLAGERDPSRAASSHVRRWCTGRALSERRHVSTGLEGFVRVASECCRARLLGSADEAIGGPCESSGRQPVLIPRQRANMESKSAASTVTLQSVSPVHERHVPSAGSVTETAATRRDQRSSPASSPLVGPSSQRLLGRLWLEVTRRLRLLCIRTP